MTKESKVSNKEENMTLEQLTEGIMNLVTTNVDVDEETIKSSNLENDLNRILAIPTRLSYLAKNLCSKQSEIEMKVVLTEFVELIRSIDSSNISYELNDSSTKAIIDVVAAKILAVLKMKTDDTVEQPKGKLIKRIETDTSKDIIKNLDIE